MIQSTETVSQLTRPIIGIENRTPLEVFDIMCDRIDHAARVSTNKDETIATLRDFAVYVSETPDEASGHPSIVADLKLRAQEVLK